MQILKQRKLKSNENQVPVFPPKEHSGRVLKLKKSVSFARLKCFNAGGLKADFHSSISSTCNGANRPSQRTRKTYLRCVDQLVDEVNGMLTSIRLSHDLSDPLGTDSVV